MSRYIIIIIIYITAIEQRQEDAPVILPYQHLCCFVFINITNDDHADAIT